MEMALKLEKEVNRSLLDMHQLATSHDDAQVRPQALCLRDYLISSVYYIIVLSNDMGLLWLGSKFDFLYISDGLL